MGKGGSFNPDTFVEGGGLIDNVDVKWTGLKIQKGYKDGEYGNATVVKVTMDTGEDAEHEELYSCGTQCEPNEAGTGMEDGGKVGRSTKFASLIDSLIGAGFPKNKIENDLTMFEGLECHMVRVIVPERKGLERPARPDGRVFKETVLLVDSITKLPWEKKKQTAPAKGKTTAPQASEDEIEGKAQDAVIGVLESNPKGIDKKALTKLLFADLKDDPDRTAIIQLTYKDSFLKEGPWTYEKGILKA